MTPIKLRIVGVYGTKIEYKIAKGTDRQGKTVWGPQATGEIVPPINGADIIHVRTESGSPDYRLPDFPRAAFEEAAGKVFTHKPLLVRERYQK